MMSKEALPYIMFHCKIYTKTFLEAENDTWSVIPSSALLQQMNALPIEQETTRWIAVIRSAGQENKIALGSPVEGTDRCLYFPKWFLDGIGINGNGDERIVRFEVSEPMPRATSLSFKVFGDIPEWVDIVEILEGPLSELGVLKRGQVLPIPLLEDAIIVLNACEPDTDFVFMDGSDISLNVENDEESFVLPPPAIEPVQPPVVASTEVPFDFTSLISTPITTPPIKPKGGFVPFQGRGRRLDGRE